VQTICESAAMTEHALAVKREGTAAGPYFAVGILGELIGPKFAPLMVTRSPPTVLRVLRAEATKPLIVGAA
jgi:hypothetical protein